MATEFNCEECNDMIVPLEEIFAALDLSLELVGQDSRLQSFRLNCRIYWCDDLVRFYSRNFSLAWLAVPNDLDGAWPYLGDCVICTKVPELLPTSHYGKMNMESIRLLDIIGLANERSKQGLLEAYRCKDGNCHRMYLCFKLDVIGLEAERKAFRDSHQLPSMIYFKVPRWEDFDLNRMFEYHRINVDRQCTF